LSSDATKLAGEHDNLTAGTLQTGDKTSDPRCLRQGIKAFPLGEKLI
jgi:hypothetical protein